MELTEEQQLATAAVVEWHKKPFKRGTREQYFKVYGPAGTGKTTLAKHIAEAVGGNVLFLAFTGKAALVLRKKGCTPASTVHSAIYKSSQDEVTGKWYYNLNYDSVAGLVDLVILDEAPMTGKDLALDLLKVSCKVLALGDQHQLPPVNSEDFFGAGRPDFVLTEIHRQAKDNPIITLSTMVREGQKLQLGNYGSSRVMKSRHLDYSMIAEHDQTLVGKNDTRKFINNMFRDGAGFKAQYENLPGPDEKLICLRNNRERGFLNGSLWKTVKKSEMKHGDVVSTIVPEDEPEADANLILTPPQYFAGDELELDWRVRKDADEFAYSYGITVHKSQGSQYSRVLILDQSRVFKEDAAKWLYTALTRAAERVTVLI